MIGKNYRKNITGIIVGLLIGLLIPISMLLGTISHGNVPFFKYIYVLNNVFGSFYGTLITEFALFTLAGFATTLLSTSHKLFLVLLVGVLISIIARLELVLSLFIVTGKFQPQTYFTFDFDIYTLVGLFNTTFFAFLGGLLYTSLFRKLLERSNKDTS